MARSRKKSKAIARKIALERIEYMFKLAGEEICRDPERSARYVLLARRIGMRNRVSIPSHLKRSLCKSCSSLLVPGRSCRVRLKEGCIIITCLGCGQIKRYPFTKKDKEPIS